MNSSRATDVYGTAEHSLLWTLHRSNSPILATAIHEGHDIDAELADLFEIEDAARLREEDPFTATIISGVPNQLVFHRSRFGIDLNRPRERCVYLTPSDAWNLNVWKRPPHDELLARLRAIHDEYYRVLKTTLEGLEGRFGYFVVLDVHSYNHRRAGSEKAPTSAEHAPDINIGTFSMDRARWAHLVESFIEFCGSRVVMGKRLDVRENIAFEGRGEQTKFIHENFASSGCAIAVEFKKIFMDEWTGEPHNDWLAELQALLTAAVPLLEQALKVCRS